MKLNAKGLKYFFTSLRLLNGFLPLQQIDRLLSSDASVKDLPLSSFFTYKYASITTQITQAFANIKSTLVQKA